MHTNTYRAQIAQNHIAPATIIVASHPSIDPAQTKASLRRDLQPSKGIQDPSVVGGALTRARAPRREGKYILHKYKYKGNAARYPKENIENHIWSTPLSPPSVIMLCIDEPKRSSRSAVVT